MQQRHISLICKIATIYQLLIKQISYIYMQSSLQKHVETNCINQDMLKYGSLLEQDDDNYTAKRKQHPIEIRKSNRDQIFQKRRHEAQKATDTNVENSNLHNKINYDYIFEDRIKGLQAYYQQEFSSEDLDQLIQELSDDDIKLKHHAVVGIRKILTIGQHDSFQTVIDAGKVKTLLQLVQQTEWPRLQLQSTWILTNITSGTTDQCRTVIEDGGIPILVNNLRCRKQIALQSVWALGNIGSDCVQFRDLVIQSNAINLICNFLGEGPDQARINQCCWTLSNLCRGYPLPKYAKIQLAISTICQFIGSGFLGEGLNSLSDCLWAISYHCEGTKKQQGVIINSKLLGKIIPILTNNSCRAHVMSILRIVGNIATGNEACTQQLLDNNVLAVLYQLLFNPNRTIRRQTCWILSNITASNQEHNMQVFQHQDLMKKIVDMFSHQTQLVVRKQLCFVFSNMTYMNKAKGNIKLDKYFIQSGILKSYLNILQEQTDNTKLLQPVLSCLYEIFMDSDRWKGQQKFCAVTAYVLEQNKVEIFEKFQYGDEGLYFEVNRILQNFFETDDPLERL